jgi:hypothetical protein
MLRVIAAKKLGFHGQGFPQVLMTFIKFSFCVRSKKENFSGRVLGRYALLNAYVMNGDKHR